MSEAIIVAIITAGASIITIVLQGRATTNKVMHEMEKHQAVTDVKIDELTREVREHNNFAKRVPVLEEKVARLEEEMRNG